MPESRLRPAAETHPIDADRLTAYLAGHGIVLDRAAPIRQFTGGFANINYLVWIDGAPAVLRRPPSGELPPGAHDMAREHRVLSRLWEVLPVAPRSFHLCTDPTVLGVPFQLIEYRAGVVVRGTDMSEIGSAPATCARLADVMIETLAAIHAVDPARVGLDTLGKPEGFARRTVEGWLKRGERYRSAAGVAALLDDLGRWLAPNVPRITRTSLLHNDFKLDNMILDPVTLAPVAVIDWDMGTRGDPLFDLATLLSYWVEPSDPEAMHGLKQMPTALTGFPTRAEVATRYARLTGTDLADLGFYRVLTVTKAGVVFLQLHERYTSGAIPDPQYADFDRRGIAMLELARDIAAGRAT